jgi:hypothetical protein
LLGRVTRGHQFLLVLIHRVWTFGTEELKRVIAQDIRIGQDLVVSLVLLTLVHSELSVLFNQTFGFSAPGDCAIQHVLQLESIVI